MSLWEIWWVSFSKLIRNLLWALSTNSTLTYWVTPLIPNKPKKCINSVFSSFVIWSNIWVLSWSTTNGLICVKLCWDSPLTNLAQSDKLLLTESESFPKNLPIFSVTWLPNVSKNCSNLLKSLKAVKNPKSMATAKTTLSLLLEKLLDKVKSIKNNLRTLLMFGIPNSLFIMINKKLNTTTNCWLILCNRIKS